MSRNGKTGVPDMIIKEAPFERISRRLVEKQGLHWIAEQLNDGRMRIGLKDCVTNEILLIDAEIRNMEIRKVIGENLA